MLYNYFTASLRFTSGAALARCQTNQNSGFCSNWIGLDWLSKTSWSKFAWTGAKSTDLIGYAYEMIHVSISDRSKMFNSAFAVSILTIILRKSSKMGYNTILLPMAKQLRHVARSPNKCYYSLLKLYMIKIHHCGFLTGAHAPVAPV